MLTKIFKSGNSMALRLPKELNAKEGEVSIERLGDKWIVEPCREDDWPKGFFDSIRIADPAFGRAPQGDAKEIEL